MDYPCDPHFITFEAVHDTIGAIYYFAAIGVVYLGNCSSGARKVLEAIHRFNKPADKQSGHRNRIGGYVISNRSNVVESRGRPYHLSHWASLSLASSWDTPLPSRICFSP